VFCLKHSDLQHSPTSYCRYRTFQRLPEGPEQTSHEMTMLEGRLIPSLKMSSCLVCSSPPDLTHRLLQQFAMPRKFKRSRVPLRDLPRTFDQLPISFDRFQLKLRALGGICAPFVHMTTISQTAFSNWKGSFAGRICDWIEDETKHIKNSDEQASQRVKCWTSMCDQAEGIVLRMREEILKQEEEEDEDFEGETTAKPWTITDLFLYLSKVSCPPLYPLCARN